MVINGLIDDKLATMSFNEHHYIIKRMSMIYFPTLYYLGVDPIFGDYIKGNDSLVVAGKLTKRDLLEKEATIYSDITITKDKEYISADKINDDTKYLKNIDVKTVECFSRIYVDGEISRIAHGLYGYKKNNSTILVTPDLDSKEFNIFDLKKELISELTMFDSSFLEDNIRVDFVSLDSSCKYLEAIIKFADVDAIHARFELDNNILKFYPFVYSETSYDGYNLTDDNNLIPISSFSSFFAKSDLTRNLLSLINKKKEEKIKTRMLARVYMDRRVDTYITK